MYLTKHEHSLRRMLHACFSDSQLPSPSILHLPQPTMPSQLAPPVVYITLASESVDDGREDVSADRTRWFPTCSLAVDVYSDDASEYVRWMRGWLKSRRGRTYTTRNGMTARITSAIMEPEHLGTSVSRRAIVIFNVTIQDHIDLGIDPLVHVSVEVDNG